MISHPESIAAILDLCKLQEFPKVAALATKLKNIYRPIWLLNHKKTIHFSQKVGPRSGNWTRLVSEWTGLPGEAKNVKRFERSNGLDTALYKSYLYILSKRLTNNPDMIDKLVDCCYERVSLGQSDFKQLYDRLASLSESERKYVCYHSECREPIVNMSMIARLRSQRVRSDSPVYLARSPGRPINTSDSARPKRTKSTTKAKVCVFSSCSFCPNDTAWSLHRAFSDGIGKSLIEIKLNTQDDHVRTCVSDLEGDGDASALEKYSSVKSGVSVFHHYSAV